MAEKIRYTRKDLKSPDEFITSFHRIVEWTKENRRRVLGGGIALVVLLALAFGTRAYLQWKEDTAARELWPYLNQAAELMQAPYSADPATVASLQKALLARVGAYPDSRAAVYARYYLGGLALLRGEYDQSIRQYRSALEAGTGPGVMKYLLMEGLGRALEAKGEYAAAAAAYRDAGSTAEAGMKAMSQVDQARALELSGKTSEAVALYQEVLREHPDSRLGDLIRVQLARMGG